MSQLRRRRFLIAVSAALACPRLVLGQTKLPTIGLLWNDSVKPSPYYVTLLRALREKGYVQDRDIRIEDRISQAGYAHMTDGALELVRSKVDVIVTQGSTATLAAAKATKDIPIVMSAGLDPVASGLAGSLARPGRNVTGLNYLNEELVAKRVEFLKELIPGLQRVGMLYDPDGARASVWLRNSEMAARSLNVQTQIAEFRSIADLEGAFGALAAARVDAIIPIPSSFLASHADKVVELAARYQKPVIYSSRRFTDAGGLLSYSVDYLGAMARAADYVHRILQGAHPGNLPIEQATKIELIVNQGTAKTLGLVVPPSILLRADRVIE